ncbi:MAG: nucleotide exchange factor GrpE [Treponema sp.]|jgi:molecular chaperone GrpE|nr:nucleotide exchange factor GrpE [Treponema sp.]
MSKQVSHGQRREGENPGPDAGSGRPEGEAVFRQENPGAEAGLNEAAGERIDAESGPEPAQGADFPETDLSGANLPEADLPPEPDRKIADLEAQLAGSKAELAESKDQYLRKVADFENFRKRINREKQDAIDFANQSLLLDLIPILDDFDRALESAKITAGEEAGTSAKDLRSFYEGVEMIARRLSSTLETRWGLKSYVSAGEPFDPNRHEALMMEKSADVPEQTVQQDLLKGYTLKDRVIRSAKVKVLVPDPAAGPAGETGAASCQEGVSGGDGAGDKTPRADFNGQN